MTSPIAAVTAGFRQYVRFSGRATRPEFWWWMLFIAVSSIVLGIIDSIIGGAIGAEDFNLLGSLFGLATLLPSFAVTTRRLHDIGKSGWWQLLWWAIWALTWVAAIIVFVAIIIGFVIASNWDILAIESWTELLSAAMPALLVVIAAAVVSLGLAIWIIIWLVRPGEPGANRYGPDPRDISNEPPAYPGQTDWYTESPR